jgi:hypothetical protein
MVSDTANKLYYPDVSGGKEKNHRNFPSEEQVIGWDSNWVPSK